MSAIQSSVGLISGIPIQDTVDQLISVASRPRNLLAGRNRELQAERSAVDTLSSLVLSLQGSLNRINATSTFNTRQVTSSSESSLQATIESGRTPAVGSYQFTPVQVATAHQLVSSNFTNPDTQLSEGTLGLRFGGHVDTGINLSQLNAGSGVAAGEIKITDRSGSSATIDLRTAQTVDDVLAAINSSSDINVTASIDRDSNSGDAFKLTDHTGGAGNLQVQEVGLGTTAADLGIQESVGAGELVGSDVFALYSGSLLSDLNDGAGVRLIDGEADLSIELSDGTTAEVNLDGSATLGDLIDAINNEADLSGKITAAIASDGNRIELTDTSSGSGSFAVTNVGESGSAADDLGLTNSASGSVITGERLASGLQDTLVSSLNGGRGISLGSIDITDRDGTTTSAIDLSPAETLGEVVDLINASGANVTASINSSRSGIQLTDDTAGSGNLIVANNGSGTTAEELGIAVNDAVATVNGGSLNRQTVSEATLLSTLKGGEGITLGDIRITDSTGSQGVLDLNRSSANIETIGDVIDEINGLNVDVTASINATGDGILITDTGGGSGALSVIDINGSAATDLQIAGESDTTDDTGQQIIDGTTTYSIDLSNLTSDPRDALLSSLHDGEGIDLGAFDITDTQGNKFTVVLDGVGEPAVTLGDVIDRINEAAEGTQVTASITENGTGIQIEDAAGGTEELTIADRGNSGSAAADLGIAGEGGGDDKITAFGLVDKEATGLEGLAARINDLEAGVTATVITTPSGSRLSVLANATGGSNQLLIDDSAAGFSFSEASRPQDAVLLYGGIAVASQNNSFDDVIDGLNLTVSTTSDTPVTVTVGADTEPIISVIEDFVAAYNSIRTNLDAVTDFDEESSTTGILFGRNEALRVDVDLGRAASGLFAVGGDYQTLEAIGLSLEPDGKLKFTKSELTDALADNSRDVERLLTDETNGIFAKFTSVIDSLAGEQGALLDSRSNVLERTIDGNIDRLERYDDTLELQRTRLLTEFFKLEETIALLQSNLSAITDIQPITFASANSSRS